MRIAFVACVLLVVGVAWSYAMLTAGMVLGISAPAAHELVQQAREEAEERRAAAASANGQMPAQTPRPSATPRRRYEVRSPLGGLPVALPAGSGRPADDLIAVVGVADGLGVNVAAPRASRTPAGDAVLAFEGDGNALTITYPASGGPATVRATIKGVVTESSWAPGECLPTPAFDGLWAVAAAR